VNGQYWLRKLFLRGKAATRPIQTRRERRVRLRVERLEDRLVPSYSLTDLTSFEGTNLRFPLDTGSLVEDSAGNLFGTTEVGGTYGYGTVFEWVKSTGYSGPHCLDQKSAFLSYSSGELRSPTS
jgi:hypothetical protein